MNVYVTLFNALNNFHKQTLWFTYNDHEKSINSILKYIHQKNLEFLAIKIWKFKNDLSPPIMNGIFFLRQNICNLRKFQELFTPTKNTEFRYGNYICINCNYNCISYTGAQLWNLIPENLKSEPTLKLFKKKIRKWKCQPCPCRMCKTDLHHLGFII